MYIKKGFSIVLLVSLLVIVGCNQEVREISTTSALRDGFNIQLPDWEEGTEATPDYNLVNRYDGRCSFVINRYVDQNRTLMDKMLVHIRSTPGFQLTDFDVAKKSVDYTQTLEDVTAHVKIKIIYCENFTFVVNGMCAEDAWDGRGEEMGEIIKTARCIPSEDI